MEIEVKINYEALSEAFLDAFRRYDDLARMIKFKLNKSLPQIASDTKPLSQVVYDLIEYFEAQGKLPDLIKKAHHYNSGNLKLKTIYQNFFPFDLPDNSILSQEKLNEFKSILEKIGNIDLLRKICRQTIERFTNAREQTANCNEIFSILEVVLKSYPKQTEDDPPAIFEFAQRLYDCDWEENKLVKSKIKEWLLESDRFPTNYPQLKKISSDEQTDTQYIAIVVSEFEPEPNLQFSLCATRFYQGESEEIDLPPESKISCFSESELRSKIVFIINNLEKIIYTQFDRYVENTIIELFLPYEQIKNNYDIDSEEILLQGIMESSIAIGEKYCIVIRCFERYDEQYSYVGYLSKLSNRWQKLQSFLKVQNCQKEEFELKIDYLKCISPNENIDDNKFWKKMANNWNDNQIVSVNLTSFSQKDNSKLDKFFQHIIHIGIPLVLWNRNPNFHFKDVKSKFNNIVNQKSLQELDKFYQLIRKVRRDAYTADNPEAEIGYHLSVLFDNPEEERIPSCINDRY